MVDFELDICFAGCLFIIRKGKTQKVKFRKSQLRFGRLQRDLRFQEFDLVSEVCRQVMYQ